MKITSFKSALLLCAAWLLSAGGAQARLWLPSDLTSTNTVWFDASDAATVTATNVGGTNYVAQWNDKSGNNNHLTQTNFTYQMVYGSRQIGGLDALEGLTNTIPGTYMELTSGIDCTTAQMALFWVAHKDSTRCLIINTTTSANRRWGLYNNNQMGYRFNSGTLRFQAVPGSWSVGEAGMGESVRIGQELYLGQNGDISQVADEGALGGTWTIIPGPYSTTGNLEGALGEVLITQALLAVADRQKIEGYLAWKWGLEGKLPVTHPYKDAPPTIPDGTMFLFE